MYPGTGAVYSATAHVFKNKYGLFCGLLYRLSLYSVVLLPGCFSRPVVEKILVLFQNDSLRFCWAQGNWEFSENKKGVREQCA